MTKINEIVMLFSIVAYQTDDRSHATIPSPQTFTGIAVFYRGGALKRSWCRIKVKYLGVQLIIYQTLLEFQF